MNDHQILTDYDVIPDSPIDLASDERILRAHALHHARRALNGDSGYAWEPIGEPSQTVREIEIDGGTLRLRQATDGDVAIWEMADGEIRLVADANGPVVITGVFGKRANA